MINLKQIIRTKFAVKLDQYCYH